MVLFSSCLVNNDLLNLFSYSIAKSSSILIFMQVTVNEKLCMVLSKYKSHYESKFQLKENIIKQGVNLYLFEIYNTKMIYNLIQYGK